MATHPPTDEQRATLDVFGAHESMIVQARAGTGKTTTLQMMAESSERRGQYVAFNRSLVDDAARRFPQSCAVRTMHSLAYRAIVDGPMRARLNAGRVRSDWIARQLGIGPYPVKFGEQAKVLQPGFLAGQVMKGLATFCNTDDPFPTRFHLPYIRGIDIPEDGKPGYENNNRVRGVLEERIAAAWRDLNSVDGCLPIKHDHYLKMWELGDPQITSDYLVVDESQDLSAVMYSVAEQNAERTQIIFVGDSEQSIYGWRGSLDATSRAQVDAILYLTQSFRFGTEVAAAANAILARLEAHPLVVGLASIPSVLEAVEQPRAILCRTNATAVSSLLAMQTSGRAAYLIGGGDDVQRFVKAAIELRDKGRTAHPDLACFTSWEEVLSYVAFDAQGDDLALLVRLISDFGADEILAGLNRMPRTEAEAEVVISTAHKAKGREWESVQLANDFDYPEGQENLGDEEWRLLYVACTRARLALDVTRAAPMCDLLGIDTVATPEKV